MKNGAGNRSEFCQSCSQHISALNYVPSNSWTEDQLDKSILSIENCISSQELYTIE
jgi:hypothetical protein